MKVTYVIVSSHRDYYIEQAIISIYSLKKYNPLVEVIVITEKNTVETLVNGREIILELIDDLKIIDIPQEYSEKQRSRYLKTSMRNYIKGDFLFIDTDTIICGGIEEIATIDASVAAVLDVHVPISKSYAERDIRRLAKKIGWVIPEDEKYYNSGVMWIKDTPLAHRLFKLWHEKWLYGVKKLNIDIDQPMLALANSEVGYVIKEMDGIYNCQVMINGLKFLYNAKIIHYFASSVDSKWKSPYRLKNKELYERIRLNGITDEVDNMISHSKSLFVDNTMILGEEASLIYATPIMGIARNIAKKIPNINNIIYNILKYLKRI